MDVLGSNETNYQLIEKRKRKGLGLPVARKRADVA
jgi:hypothetical protein